VRPFWNSPLKKGAEGVVRIWYNPKLKTQARELCKQDVLSEVLIREHLKDRKMRGYQLIERNESNVTTP
jgi:hypothetical protein